MALSSAVDAGWPVVWSGDDEGASVRFAYLAPSSREATIREIMELTGVSNGMAQLVRAAAQDWDGSDPVRSLRLLTEPPTEIGKVEESL